MTHPIHVVAGIVSDSLGRVLVAQRPPGKHLAGCWEFPGGKVEHGEAPLDALRRELFEEIGIDVESARPLIAVPWSYPEKNIVLDAWRVDAYTGDVHAREAQALQWSAVDALSNLAMPPADRPIVNALRLPDRYLITPAMSPDARDTLLEGIERACDAGIRLIQFRQPDWSSADRAIVAVDALAICQRYGANLLLNADWQTAARQNLDGVHLPARIAAKLTARPLARGRWVGVSCHDEAELAQALKIDADFVTLAPVAPTPSHPDAHPLGWPRFAALTAAAALPVYALGGLGAEEIATAHAYGAQGIAAIRALWA